MSQYATAAELQATPGAAAYVEGLADAELDVALGRASALIDGYVSARTTLPLTTVPESLKQAAIHIAAWYLASGRGFDTGAVGNTAKRWHDWWLDWLASVAAGKVPLPGVTDTATSTSGARVSTGAPRGW